MPSDGTGDLKVGEVLVRLAAKKDRLLKELAQLLGYFTEKVQRRQAVIAMTILLFYTSAFIFMELQQMTPPSLSGTCRWFISILAVTFLFVDHLQIFGYPADKFTPILLMVLSVLFALSALPVTYAESVFSSQNESDEAVPPTPVSGVWEICVVIIICLTMTPLSTRKALDITIGLPLLHTSLLILRRKVADILPLVCANLLIFFCFNLVGIVIHMNRMRMIRKSFSNARINVHCKREMDCENKKLDRLLVSVLPENLARVMKKDAVRPLLINATRKVYIEKHDDVSILFADIVGFTKLTAAVSAEQLVTLLNELFGKFDKFCKKNKCYRIKLLGDCYFSVTGLPLPIEDHALRATRFGKDIVAVIKEVQSERQLPSKLDMRVGVHTGSVFSGVIGFRKWQYEVWSNDVAIANNMESAGSPGRVHISHQTYESLGAAVEVSPGQTNDYLKKFQIKTYFLASADGSDEPKVGASSDPDTALVEKDKTKLKSDSSKSNPDLRKDVRIARKYPSLDSQEENQFFVIGKFLKKAIDFRWSGKYKLDTMNGLLLTFSKKKMERRFNMLRDVAFFQRMLTMLLLATALSLTQYLTLSTTVMLPMGLLAMILWVVLIVAMILTARAKLMIRMAHLNLFSVPVYAASIFSLFLIIQTNILYCYPDGVQCTDGTHARSLPGNLAAIIESRDHGSECKDPHYIFLLGMVCLVGVMLFETIPFLIKAHLATIIFSSFILIVKVTHRMNFECYDEQHSEKIPLGQTAVLALSGMWILVILQTYEGERSARIEFLWTNVAHKEQQEAHELKEGNRRLIYNILPVHVVKSYVLQPKKKYRELYFAKHEAVGVMFTRVSNFEDYFIREQQAGRGLDSLSCLNAIITDFDKLLDIDPYHNVEKIKTIGAAFMCAIGLESSSKERPSQGKPARMSVWDLVVLGDLYFEMSALLKKNTACDFKLRGGISTGTIVAGVIGAIKPHFDIWGDPVNEASRMEYNSEPNSCLVTQPVAMHVQDYFELDGPHVKDVKGKGVMETFFLRRRKPKAEVWTAL